MSIDARNLLPAMVYGEGIPFLERGQKATLLELDAIVKRFIQENQAIVESLHRIFGSIHGEGRRG